MNESYDIHLINTVEMLADRHGCRDEATLSRKLAETIGG